MMNETKQSTELFPVKQNGKYGYMDRTGKIVMNPQFGEAGYFSEGLACVSIGGKLSYIHKTGKFVWGPIE